MSDRRLTASSGAVTPMWRRDNAGKLIEIPEPDRNDYVIPPRATRGRFVLSGISDTFEMIGDFGVSRNVRVEFLIEKATGNVAAVLNGKRFTQLFTWKVSAKSNLGQLLGALRGQDIQAGEEVAPDDYIGTSFVTSTTLKETANGAYAGVSIEAIDPSKTKLSPHLNGATPEPALVAAGGVEELEDPFEQGDDL